MEFTFQYQLSQALLRRVAIKTIFTPKRILLLAVIFLLEAIDFLVGTVNSLTYFLGGIMFVYVCILIGGFLRANRMLRATSDSNVSVTLRDETITVESSS